MEKNGRLLQGEAEEKWFNKAQEIQLRRKAEDKTIINESNSGKDWMSK